MEPITDALERAEAALDAGRGLAGTGFWPAVRAVKEDPTGVDLHRIAAIDRRAFEAWALIKVPVRSGTVLACLALAVGLALIGLAYRDIPLRNWVFLVGFGIVWVTTHGLGHLSVGRALGMRFTHWFVGTLRRPQPGVKVDYATYLTAPARHRAWMHASGAVVSKLIPFLLLPPAYIADVSAWVPLVVAGFGVISLVTDIMWSTKVSDWKKYRREMGFASTG